MFTSSMKAPPRGRNLLSQPSRDTRRPTPFIYAPIFYFCVGCLFTLLAVNFLSLGGAPGTRRELAGLHPLHEALEGKLKAEQADKDLFAVEPVARDRPVIVITPTYERVDQIQALLNVAELLSNTPPPVIWIVIEDPATVTKNDNTVRVVKTFDLPNTWVLRTQAACNLTANSKGACNNTAQHRGLQQRNLGLFFVRNRLYDYRPDLGFGGCVSEELTDFLMEGEEPIQEDPNVGRGMVIHGPSCDHGTKPKEVDQFRSKNPDLDEPENAWAREPVVYLADDDNVYESRLFNLIRNTKKLGALPVGFVFDRAEAPVVVNRTKITGWSSIWCAGRRFPLDMAGMAFSLPLILKARHVTRAGASPLVKARAGKPVRFLTKSKFGHLETDLLEQMAEDESDFQPIGGAEIIFAYHMKAIKAREKFFLAGHPMRAQRKVKQPVKIGVCPIPK